MTITRETLSTLTSYFVRKDKDAVLQGKIMPSTDDLQDIGSSIMRWNALYVKEVHADSLVGTFTGDHGALGGLGDDDHTQYVHNSTARSITAQHTFAPATAIAPFLLNANAQGVVVTGLLADHVSKTITAGNGLSGGGALSSGAGVTISLQTPGTLTYATTNVATGSHTHAVTNSANPGATQTLLATDSAGGTQLLRLGIGVAPDTNNKIKLVDDGIVGSSTVLLQFDDTANNLLVTGSIVATISKNTSNIRGATITTTKSGSDNTYTVGVTSELLNNTTSVTVTDNIALLANARTIGSAATLRQTALTLASQNSSSGNITTLKMLEILTPTKGAGTISEANGIYVENINIASTNYAIRTNAGNVVFNEGGDAASDFRVEGDTDQNLFVVDASADKIGIGTASPSAKFQLDKTFTDASGYPAAFTLNTTSSLPSGSTAWPYTMSLMNTVYPTYTIGNATVAGYTAGVRDGAGNVTSLNGLVLTVGAGGSYSGTIGQMYGLRFINSGITEGSVTGTIQTMRFISIDAVYENSGSILGVEGLFIGNINVGSTYNYAIRTNAGIVQFGDDLEFSAAKSIKSTSTYNLTLAPGGDLILNPTGNDVLPETTYDINLGGVSKKYLTLHAAELRVETLVATDTLATIGGRVLVGATTLLTSDLAAAGTTIYVKHNELANGDIIYLESAGNVEFMQVTSTPSGVGPYSYTVTRNLDSTGANDWYAGDAVFNTGTTGNGFIDIYSIRSVKSATQYGPTIVGNVRNSATYNAWTEHWAIGNLNGLYGYSTDTYGAGLGKYGADHIVVDPTNGVRFRDSSANVLAQITAAAFTLGSTTTEHVNITSTSVQIKDGATVLTEIGAGTVTVGLTTQDHVSVSSTGFQVKDGSVVKFDAQTDGDVFIGTDVATPGDTYFSIFSQAQTYNTESIEAGDMLIGDNTATKANILWDKSTGSLKLRLGTETKLTLDSYGLNANGGASGYSSNGFTVVAESSGGGGDAFRYKIKSTGGGVFMGYLGGNFGGVTDNVRLVADGDYLTDPVDLILTATDGWVYITPTNYPAKVTGEFQVSEDVRINGGLYVGSLSVDPAAGEIFASSDVRTGGGIYVGSTSVDPTAGQIWTTGSVFINDTSNVKSTTGLTINQGATTDEAISLKSSNVSHGMTTVTEDDTYGWFAPLSADGGMKVRGMTETIEGINVHGLFTTGDTSRASTTLGAVTITGSKKTGTTIGSMATGESILGIRNYNTTKFIFDADGTFFYTGNLHAYRNSASYTGFIFVPLTTPYTSTDWDGNDNKTTGTYNIDLSAWNAALTGVKAVLVRLAGEVTTTNSGYYMALRPRGGSSDVVRLVPQVNLRQIEMTAVVPTDATNSDIDVVVTGATHNSVRLEIWGYWI